MNLMCDLEKCVKWTEARLAKLQPRPDLVIDSDDGLRNAYFNRKALFVVAMSGALAIVSFLWPTGSHAQGSRPLTVRDSIEMATFAGDPHTGIEEVKFSPDGHYFFVITRRGVLQFNELESRIWVFDSAAVGGFLKHPSGGRIPDARSIVKMAAAANDDPITQARWAADSESIAFLGREKHSERHLFVVTLRDGLLKQLTPSGQDVTGFDCAKGVFVYTTAPLVTDAQLYQSGGPTIPDIQIGTGLSLFNLLYPEWEKFTFSIRARHVWQVRGGETSPVVDPATSTQLSLITASYSALLSLSPSGRYAVVTNIAAHVPLVWESYETAYASSFTKIIADKPNTKPTINFYRPLQYELIDLQSGKMSALLDAPLGQSAGFYDALTAVWSHDEKEVALANTFLPLEGKTAGGHPTRPCVAVVAIATRKVDCVKPSPVGDFNKTSTVALSDIEWRGVDQQLVLRYFDYRAGDASKPELFQRENGAWKPVADSTAVNAAAKAWPAREFSIDVNQSINEPPILTATNAANGQSKEIWDPNPQFARINLGEATVYNWHDKAGHEWTGGLVKPPDYVAGRRYPLVIQTHGFNPKKFLTDGAFTTANAARPLAGRGIVVLQVGEITTDALATPREPADDGREGYVSAIEQLAADGLIDPQRVGIIGFSRTGWYVLDSLIHAPKYFAAATLAECTYESFGEYLLNADYLGPQRAKGVAEGIGSEPFGAGIQKWLSDSPGFSTDKIHVPVFFEAHNPPSMIYAWDIYASLRLQAKPVELLYFRNGVHILTKPLERLVSQEMNVDWYGFWLNGEEDPDPAKAEQYKRWREMRKLQDQSQSKSPVQ